MKAKILFLTMVAALIACSPVMAQSRIDKIVDVDHADDIATAEAFLAS